MRDGKMYDPDHKLRLFTYFICFVLPDHSCAGVSRSRHVGNSKILSWVFTDTQSLTPKQATWKAGPEKQTRHKINLYLGPSSPLLRQVN